MDRTQSFQDQHSEAMRPAEPAAIELLLLRHGRVGGEPPAEDFTRAGLACDFMNKWVVRYTRGDK